MKNLRWTTISGVVFIALSVFVTSCKKKETPVECIHPVKMKLTPVFDNEAFALNTVYTDVLGNRLTFEDFKVYLSNIYAVHADGSKTLLDDIHLTTLSEPETLTFDLVEGDYQGIEFSIGVPEDVNKDSDPTVWPNDHPLSVSGAQGMFWHWNTGYIFMKVEGKADTLGVDGNPLLHPFAYHCGDDPLFVDHTFNIPFSLSEAQPGKDIDVVFDVSRFFYNDVDTIDVAQDYLTHTSGNYELAERFTALFNEAIEVSNE